MFFIREWFLKSLLVIAVLFVARVATAQVSVTDNLTAQQLVHKLTGSGVVVLNPHLVCPVQASGAFTTVSSNLGLDSGIVLTTGRAASTGSLIGVNGGAFNHASTRNNAAGDNDLEALVGRTTYDGCTLEFDVIPQGDTVKFDYVFGSEEYINATCGPYNDAFAFFISGPGISGLQNMALVPGTNIPVTINSINSGVPGANYSLSGCTSMGPGSPFVNYYIDNTNGTTITYQGFTKVLQAMHAVIPCSTYHLKMVIVDAGNAIYDSGVFIRAGSLKANTYTVKTIPPAAHLPKPVQGDAFAVKECTPGKFRVERTQVKATPQTVKFLLGGTAVSGIDYISIPDSVVIPANQISAEVLIQGIATPAAGPKTVTLLVKSPNNCSGALIADSATLVLYDTISVQIKQPVLPTVCLGDEITMEAIGDTLFTYQWSPAAAFSNPNARISKVKPLASAYYEVAASWPEMGCAAKRDSVRIDIRPVPEITYERNLHVCLHKDLQLGVVVNPPYPHYTYTWSGPGGFNASVDSPVIVDAGRQRAGKYMIVVGLDTSSCTATASLNVIVDETPLPLTEPVIFCQGKPAAQLYADGKQLLWYEQPTGGVGNRNAPLPNTDNIGSRSWYVSQTLFGCESERAVLPVEVKVCCDKPVFVPTAFTPNKDGRNDLFGPAFSGYGYSIKRMRIFNRWGQMVYQSFYGGAWDGTFNGADADAGTYYYEVLVNCKEGGEQQFKGDVILIR